MKRSAAPSSTTELVINMASRRAAQHADHIMSSLKQAGVTLHKVHKLKSGASLHRVMKGVVSRRPSMVIVASGDGTVSDVVDYLATTTIELGVIPLGTTNNFARSLGVSLDIDQAIKNISSGRSRKVDLGSVNGDLFSNVAGIGLSAEVAKAVTDTQKRRYGRLAYMLVGLQILRKHQPFHATIKSANSSLSLNIYTHQLIIANGRYHAGKEIAQDAALDTRELVVFKLGGTSRLSLLWQLLDYYVGNRKKVARTAYLLAKDIQIKTDREVSIELDGEVKKITPARVTIKPAAILVRH